MEQAGIAGSRGAAACFLDLVVSQVGKTEDGLAEILAELALSGQHLETGDFGRPCRVENEIAVSHKDRSRYFAGHRRDKTDRPGAQMKSGNIAMDRQVADSDAFAAEREITQLLISGIGVARGSRDIGGKQGKRQAKQKDHVPRRATNYG